MRTLGGLLKLYENLTVTSTCLGTSVLDYNIWIGSGSQWTVVSIPVSHSTAEADKISARQTNNAFIFLY